MNKEIWKDITGYEGYYQISNKGNVRSLDRVVNYKKTDIKKEHKRKIKGKIMSKKYCKGYGSAHLNKDGVSRFFRVCRLVAIHFIPNPENKPQVNHIDGDKSNDFVKNLEWCTPKENMKHAKDNGLISIYSGADNINSIKIKCLVTGQIFNTIKDASKYANCDQGHLSRMLRGIYKNTTTLDYA